MMLISALTLNMNMLLATQPIDGYVIEGHVPAEDIKRLLAEKPDAIGLSAPGMPIGSPGMDGEAYADAKILMMLF